jgi:hypothetical protein
MMLSKLEPSASFTKSKMAFDVHTIKDDSTILLLTVPIIIEANGIQIKSVGLLDQGSKTSLFLDTLSNKLGLVGSNEISPLLTLYGYDPNEKVKLVSFNIMSNSFRSFNVKTAYAVQRLKFSNIKFDWNTIRHHWPHLSNIDPINVDSLEIGVLLGRNVLRINDVLDTRYPAHGVETLDGIKPTSGGV